MFVDGAARGQGQKDSNGDPVLGHGAAAAMIYRNKKLIGQYARGLGRVSNSQAEYEAILLGVLMSWAADLHNPVVYSDSQSAINQLSGKWQCKSQNLIPLYKSIMDLKSVYNFHLVKAPRSNIGEVDCLVNEFLDEMLEKPKQRKQGKRSIKNAKRAE